jgi:ABC-type amino acid transport substrate-binding protein
MRRTALAAALAVVLSGSWIGGEALAQAQAPGPTLSAVRQRDTLACGAHPGAPGFGLLDSQGVYRGLDADTCRAVAAAVLGDANKVRWVVLTAQARLPALQSGQVDLLARTTTWTQTRDTANGLNFAATNFYDGQGFLVRRALNVGRARELEGATVCVTSGTTNELNLADWARAQGVRIQPLVFDQNDETRLAYIAGRWTPSAPTPANSPASAARCGCPRSTWSCPTSSARNRWPPPSATGTTNGSTSSSGPSSRSWRRRNSA